MNYTHLYLVGQGIAIGNNFYVIDNVSINYDSNEYGYASIDIPLTPLTKVTVGNQPIEDYSITQQRESDA